jgi:hypothetical protein
MVEKTESLPLFPGELKHPVTSAPPAPTVIAKSPKPNSNADPCNGDGPYPEAL